VDKKIKDMKVSLKNLNLKEVERLSREQLKDVLGGFTGSGGNGGGGSGGSIGPTSCPTNCFRTEGGNIAAGTCTLKSDNINGVISNRCECSLAGASC
jgi:hypothetical protein